MRGGAFQAASPPHPPPPLPGPGQKKAAGAPGLSLGRALGTGVPTGPLATPCWSPGRCGVGVELPTQCSPHARTPGGQLGPSPSLAKSPSADAAPLPLPASPLEKEARPLLSEARPARSPSPGGSEDKEAAAVACRRAGGWGRGWRAGFVCASPARRPHCRPQKGPFFPKAAIGNPPGDKVLPGQDQRGCPLPCE